MKTSLEYSALLFAAAVPVTLAAGLADVSVPATVDTLHVFAAFVGVLVLLIVLRDYSRPKPRLVPAAQPIAAKAAHPLAA